MNIFLLKKQISKNSVLTKERISDSNTGRKPNFLGGDFI